MFLWESNLPPAPTPAPAAPTPEPEATPACPRPGQYLDYLNGDEFTTFKTIMDLVIIEDYPDPAVVATVMITARDLHAAGREFRADVVLATLYPLAKGYQQSGERGA